MTTIDENFDSVLAFITTMDKRKLQAGFSESSETGRPKWCGTESYKAATDLALYGDMESKSKVQAAVDKIKVQAKLSTTRNVARTVRSVVGTRPCVPAAVQGLPNAMYRRLTVKVQKPVVTVAYSMTALASVDADTIIETGAKLATAIQLAERNGVHVNLYAGITARAGKQIGAPFVKIKDSNKDFDLLRMAYVLINPSFLRRHFFRWVERTTGLDASSWAVGYGRPLEEGELKELKLAFKPDHLLAFNQIRHLTVQELAGMITGKVKQ